MEVKGYPNAEKKRGTNVYKECCLIEGDTECGVKCDQNGEEKCKHRVGKRGQGTELSMEACLKLRAIKTRAAVS